MTTPVLNITNLQRTNQQSDRDNAALTWDIYYTGNDPGIREDLEVSLLNSNLFSYVATTSALKNDRTGTYTMDISDLMPGTYLVKVTGSVSDASSSFSIAQFTIPPPPPKSEIVIH